MSSLDFADTKSDIIHAATFRLGDEWYGIDVLVVQEVMNPLPITAVPLAPDYIIGLINVRGLIVSAISLKARLGYSDQSYGPDHHNIIVNNALETVCFRVDEIGDVIMTDKVSWSDKPSTIAAAAQQFVTGVLKMDNRLITHLDAIKLATS